MTKTNVEKVLNAIDQEGFDYTFRDYSSFKLIRDEKFHELRKAYIAAADALDSYIDEQAELQGVENE